MEEKSVALISQVTKQDLDSWLFGSGTKLTDPQKQLFYQIALAHNLNPAKREIYAIPYGSNFNVITGYEVYLKRAERTGLLEYWEAGVKKENNEWIGFCTIKRKDRIKETTIEAWFNEYNQNNNMWKTKPRTMIRKVAIAQAFRMVFPDELGGLPYTADEIGTNDQIIEVQPQIEMTKVEKMIALLNDVGKLEKAESFLGKPSSEWTETDIDKIEETKAKKNKKSSSELPTIDDRPKPDTNDQIVDEITTESLVERFKNISYQQEYDELCHQIGDLFESGLSIDIDTLDIAQDEARKRIFGNDN